MSGEFDVFDEWGNFVGKFTRAGAGGEGCFLTIAVMIVATFAFAVYLLVKLTVEGFRAAFQKKWDKAVLYWLAPGLTALFLVVSMMTAAATQANEVRLEKARSEEIAWAQQEPNAAFTVVRTGGVGGEFFFNERPWHVAEYYGVYRVTNNTRHLTVVGQPGASDCGVRINGYFYPGDRFQLSPGQTADIYCEEVSHGEPTSSDLVLYDVWTEVARFHLSCLGDC